MAANQYKDLDWVDKEASAYMEKLSFLGATGIDVVFAYVRGYAIVKEIFDALTEGDRGGQIAYTLVRDKNPQVIRDWVINLQPQALGPLLLTLSNAPQAFTSEDEEQTEAFDEDQAYLLQQRAIEKCLTWISAKPNAPLQFEEAIICMNRDGARPSKAGFAYCANKLKLDTFMAERVLSLQVGANEMRKRYRSLVSTMGARLNGHCSYQTEYKGPAFAPVQKIKSTYKGPNID